MATGHIGSYKAVLHEEPLLSSKNKSGAPILTKSFKPLLFAGKVYKSMLKTKD
jgi:hypothetical protein